ncbi:relaxase/mobilization nuclease RlxS [Sphingomonas sp.]|uniref:relaxase/mobilization nuclease RlxS n=1 Tax=Sphingomonas sp. TaxID=28214 RepID=UPI0025D204AF|nr:relaxase/mobilization nuclease RlxS [Sphingomonas sp.]
MSDDEDFTPRLGRQRAQGNSKSARRYLAAVIAAAALAGAAGGPRGRRFTGSRIGRGASMARVLVGRDRLAGFRARRAMVKTRLVRLGSKGVAGARAHLRYIQRDGVTRDGLPGELYAANDDSVDGKAFLERGATDRHQFRLIVSVEDGADYADLKPYVRRLMLQVEADLGTTLDWVAVDHFNTAHPHTHIMVRGVDDQGHNLVIAPEYIAHGMRERAAELATLDLGPRTDAEIQATLRRDIDAERLTQIDRQLLRAADGDRHLSGVARDPFIQALRAGRLQKLATMNLAKPISSGRWQLAEDLEKVLQSLGERGDIVRTMQRELAARGLERKPVVALPGEDASGAIVGSVIGRGLADEHRDRHYLIIDGTDGHAHYVDIGRPDAVPPLIEGAIVQIIRRTASARASDRLIDEVAAAHDGRYSLDDHLRYDPWASPAYAEAHLRRLEAQRRAGLEIERHGDGSWTIPRDYLNRVTALDERRLADRPIELEILAPRPLADIIHADAGTWLDRQLAGEDVVPARDAGFGKELRSALAIRQQWLLEHDLADLVDGRLRVRPLAFELLRRREILRLGKEVAQELGKEFVEAQKGESIAGRLSRRIDAAGGQYALVEGRREFALVPWRHVLENRLGTAVTGLMRDHDVTWRFGRDRNGPQL